MRSNVNKIMFEDHKICPMPSILPDSILTQTYRDTDRGNIVICPMLCYSNGTDKEVNYRMYWNRFLLLVVIAYRSNNFIIGLTNVSPVVRKPNIRGYTKCGRYPGAVPAGATVSVNCRHNLPKYRYVIVQMPLVNDFLNFCEVKVLVPGSGMYVLT